ncbi:MAG: DUF4190 domain-containing protein [Bradymonadaceae bacterium]
MHSTDDGRSHRRASRGSQAGGGPSAMAIAALVLGIGAWTFLPWIGGVIGAIVGWIELENIERGESPEAGEAIARVGFWLSAINAALGVLAACVAVTLVLFGVSIFAMLGLA